MIYPLVIYSYLFVGIFIWFSPKEHRLISSPLSWKKKLAYTFVWPAYLMKRTNSWHLKMFIIGLMCLVAWAMVLEIIADKSYSLKSSDIKGVSTGKDFITHLTFEDMIRQVLEEDRDKYEFAIGRDEPSELIKLVDSPAKAAAAIALYITRNKVEESDVFPSMKNIHNDRMPIDCTGAAVIAASLLADNGFTPYLLSMRTSSWRFLLDIFSSSSHMVFVYKSGDLFGYVGLQNASDPVFPDLDSLIASISADLHVVYTKYFLLNLDEYASNHSFGNSENLDWKLGFRTKEAGLWDYLF
ncbi:MAG: hypothetical protein Q7K65_01010 [Candidatus Buchananbacteria bacterium]|nr:hypothetical protein [Candidatus Buchananbacteria bacterium]